jgi:4-hydroxymandelate oxidase
LIDLERRAQEVLDPATYAFFAGGAGDELTLAANRAAFAETRVPVDVAGSASVLGVEVSPPVLIAPVGFQTLLHPDGELATARAAARAGTVMCVSMVSEAAPAEFSGGRLWFQLYWLRDRDLVADVLRQAREAGFEAVVLTVDSPALGRRDRSLRSGWRFPESFRIRSTGLDPAALAAMLDPSVTWSDLEWLAGTAGLPLVLKGILTGEDARLAADHGAAAIVVSNHGGRQLDAAPATLSVLPEVVAAADDRLEVLIDGGIRRGTDVLKALALGARAVLVGRAPMWGLAVAGEEGVTEVLQGFADELAGVR